MANLLGAWVWDLSPAIFSVMGREIRWYGLLFALGFWLGNMIMHYIYRSEGRDRVVLERLPVYVILATIVGARLGHVFFYDPGYYFAHPIKILYVWEGGLASHGAAIGIAVAVVWYCMRYKVPYLMLLDRLIIVGALGAACIRIGNFTNSEIYGRPTDSNYGVVFIPRGVVRYMEQALEVRPEVGARSTDLSAEGRAYEFMGEPLELRLSYRGIDSLRLLQLLSAAFGADFCFGLLRSAS